METKKPRSSGQICLIFENKPTLQFTSGETAVIEIFLRLNQDIHDNITVGCNLKNKYTTIYGINTRWEGCDIINPRQDKDIIVRISIPLNLNNGLYSLTIAAGILHVGGDSNISIGRKTAFISAVVHPIKWKESQILMDI